MKKILFASLVFASACILMAQQGTDGGEFSTETRLINQQMSVVITGYNGTSTQIHVPDQIGGLPVVAIGDNAFRSRRIESVTFPPTLVSIGNYAFYGNNLKVISIPPAVINIGIGAFDSNALGGTTLGNASPNQKGTARTFTIEPAHSETVYRPKSNQSAPENVNIIVVPGYDPLQLSTRPNGSIVAVQQSPNASPAVTAPTVMPNRALTTAPAVTPNRTLTTAPAVTANRTLTTAPAVTPNRTLTTAPAVTPNQAVTVNPPVQSNQSLQPQQLYGYVQQTPPPSNSANRLNVIPENTIDLSTGQSKAAVPEEAPEEERKPIQLYRTETYDIGHTPTPR